MASNIVPDTIDDAYPVAGQDNDSQGFRDNFNIIKTNFTYSKQEIEDLQDNTAKTNAENNFFENDLFRYNSRQQTHESVANLIADVTQEISFATGHYFSYQINSDVTFSFTNWPTNEQYAEMTLEIKHNSSLPYTVTFAAEYSTGLPSTLRVEDTTEFGGTAAIVCDAANNKSQLIKAFSYDNGITVYLQHMGTFVAAA